MYDTILVPLDGLKCAERILPYVERLALGDDSRAVFLQVDRPLLIIQSEGEG